MIGFALVACGKKDGDKGGGDKGGGGKPASAAIDVAAVNALVPAALKDKLVFEKRDIPDESSKKPTTWTLAAPKGWEQKMKMFAKVRPPDSADMGFMTEFGVSSNCNGSCEPKDWAAESDKVNFAQFKTNGSKIEKDEKGANDRTLIAATDDKRYVVYAWWTSGAKKYFYCTATLEKQVMDAAPAFEKACKAVSVSGDD
jgi:hypothetical protein